MKFLIAGKHVIDSVGEVKGRMRRLKRWKITENIVKNALIKIGYDGEISFYQGAVFASG